jgi:PKHD-type hydroxylase|tara:strand:+ start:250 stop:873 length:624 start_codon:yes stop_codon:yes gene_type:complete
LDFLTAHIPPSTVDTIYQPLLTATEWRDGKENAGEKIRSKKIQHYLSFDSQLHNNLCDSVYKILEHDIIKTFTLPRTVTNLMFTKTEVGGKYGGHYDSVCMYGTRLDYSFTLFLNDDYTGGELEVNGTLVKPKKGKIFIYPTRHYHQVKEVTDGTRYVAVGWITSLIQDTDIRTVVSKLKEVSTQHPEVEQKLLYLENILLQKFGQF